jgi:hypothetical protein
LKISVLGELLKKYPFLKGSLISVYVSDAGLEKYGRISQDDAKSTIDLMLSLTR